MRVKKKSEKASLKLNNQKTKTMVTHPITLERVEAMTDFIFLGSKITVDSDCSHEIKDPCSLKESYDKSRQHIQKQRHHFADKGL